MSIFFASIINLPKKKSDNYYTKLSKQIIKAGELASAEEAFIINIIEFGQKGVPKIIRPKQKNENSNDRDEDLSSLFTFVNRVVMYQIN